jgi:hypothetical protein
MSSPAPDCSIFLGETIMKYQKTTPLPLPHRNTLMRSLRISAMCVFACSAAFGSEPQDRNAQIMKSIYSKLEDVLGVNDYQAARRSSMLIIAAPGLQIDQTLNLSRPEDQQKLVELLDVVPQASWVYRTSSSNASDIYQAVLDHHEAAITSLTPAQKAQLIAAQKVIYRDSSHVAYSDAYKRYRETRDALSYALEKLQDFERANPGVASPATSRNAVAHARDDFDFLGDKNAILASKAVIDNLENLEPATFWGKLRERYNDNVFPVGAAQVPVYDLLPDFRSWLNDSQSWQTVQLTDADVESHSSSSHSSVSGGVGGGWGLFSFGGSYGHSESSTHVDIDGKDFTLSFELLRAQIRRPWMDSIVFKSGTWQWQPDSMYGTGTQLISNGADVDAGQTPTGLMPFLTTEVILARRVKLTATWGTDVKNTFEQQTTTSVRAGWGPFSGSYSRTDSSNSADSSVKISGNTITFEKPQIIGYLIEAEPLSPNPRKGLKFPSDKSGPLIGGKPIDDNAKRLYNAAKARDSILMKEAQAFE